MRPWDRQMKGEKWRNRCRKHFKHPKLEMHVFWQNIITHLNKFCEIMHLKKILLLERGWKFMRRQDNRRHAGQKLQQRKMRLLKESFCSRYKHERVYFVQTKKGNSLNTLLITETRYLVLCSALIFLLDALNVHWTQNGFLYRHMAEQFWCLFVFQNKMYGNICRQSFTEYG